MPTHNGFDDAHTEELFIELAATREDDPRWEQIRSELVRIHVPLVRHIVRRYARNESKEDIEQAAMLGLVKAINRYDPDFGGRFLPFAMPTMTGEVKRYFRDHTWAVRVPRHLQELSISIRQARYDFVHEHGRSPGVPEISAILGMPEEEIIEALGATEAYQAMSLDAPVSEDHDTVPRGELLGDLDPELEQVVNRTALRPLLEQLPARERTILMYRFYGNKTQSDIAELLGLSQMHVSRLIIKSLARLRDQLLQDA